MMDVHLCQDSSPCRQWIVELRKPGCRFPLGRWPRDCRGPAETLARELARFLDVPLRITKTTAHVCSQTARVLAEEPHA
jgi:hypothetical protein